jgi:hypothetical protein
MIAPAPLPVARSLIERMMPGSGHAFKTRARVTFLLFSPRGDEMEAAGIEPAQDFGRA